MRQAWYVEEKCDRHDKLNSEPRARRGGYLAKAVFVSQKDMEIYESANQSPWLGHVATKLATVGETTDPTELVGTVDNAEFGVFEQYCQEIDKLAEHG